MNAVETLLEPYDGIGYTMMMGGNPAQRYAGAGIYTTAKSGRLLRYFGTMGQSETKFYNQLANQLSNMRPAHLGPFGKGKTTNKVEYVTKERKTLGSDGASSEHIIEKINDKTNSTTHKVIKDNKIIHQHQDYIGKYGTKKQFPDSWTGTETINAK